MTLADLLPLAIARCGLKASVRLTLTGCGTYVAAAYRSTTTGEGAELYVCAVERSESDALSSLADKLRGRS